MFTPPLLLIYPQKFYHGNACQQSNFYQLFFPTGVSGKVTVETHEDNLQATGATNTGSNAAGGGGGAAAAALGAGVGGAAGPGGATPLTTNSSRTRPTSLLLDGISFVVSDDVYM